MNKRIDRATFSALLKEHVEVLTDHPVVGDQVSAMQWLNGKGKPYLSALYMKTVQGHPASVMYYVNEEERPE